MDDGIAAGLQTDSPGRLRQEGAFPGVRLDQMNLRDAKERQNQPRKAGAAADVSERRHGRGQEGDKLGGIQHMATPEIGQAVRANEVDLVLPLYEKVRIVPKSRQCFT